MASIEDCNCSSSQNLKNKCPMFFYDGRGITRYEPRCSVNNEIMKELEKNNIPLSSYNIRRYLQTSPSEMERQRNTAIMDIRDCYPCKNTVNRNPELMSKYVVRCNQVSCQNNQENPKGIGTSVKY